MRLRTAEEVFDHYHRTWLYWPVVGVVFLFEFTVDLLPWTLPWFAGRIMGRRY